VLIGDCVKNDFWREIEQQPANAIGIADVGYAKNATNAVLMFRQS